MAKYIDNYPAWAKVAWRTLRIALWAGVMQTVALQIDWTNQETAGKAALSAFLTGFAYSLIKAIRDEASDGDPSAMVNKLPL